MSEDDSIGPQPLDSIPPELQEALDGVGRVLAEHGQKALCAMISADDGHDHGIVLYAVGMPMNMAADIQEGLNRLLQDITGALVASDRFFGKSGLPSTPMDNAAQNLARALIMQHEKGEPTALSVSLRVPHNPDLSVIVAAALTLRSKAEGGFYRELDALMKRWIGPGRQPQAEPA